MSEETSLKWQKLLWSFVAIGAIALFFSWQAYPSTDTLGYGFDLWVFALIASFACAIISPIVILLRLFRIIKNRESFGYIFIGTFNFCVGVYGVFQLAGMHLQRNNYILFVVFIVSLLCFGFIFTDTFIKERRGVGKV